MPSVSQKRSAIHMPELAIDPFPIVGREERDRTRDVVGLAKATVGQILQHIVHIILRQMLGHRFGQDDPRANAIGADALLPELTGDVPDERM